MENSWKTLEIGDLIEVLTDYTANGSFASLKENVKYYNSENYAALVRTTDLEKKVFAPERFTDQHGYEYLKKSSLFGGEIVIANVGSTGKIYIVPKYTFPMTLAPNMYLIKFKNEVDNLFGFYLMSSPYFQKTLKSRIASTTLAAINKTSIKTIKVPVPEKAVQLKIVSILSTLDKAIQKTDQIIEKTEKLKNGLVDKLLTKGIGHTKFKKTQIGEIPEEWKITRLDEISFNITDGKHGDCESESDSGYYFVSVKDIHDGFVDCKHARQITKSDFEEAHKRTKLEVGDLLLTNSGTIGRMAVITDENMAKVMTFQKSVAIIKPNPDIVNVYYLMQFLQRAINSLVAKSNGSAQVNLLLRDIRSIKIDIPPISEQVEIAARIREIDNKIAIEKRTKEYLLGLKLGLTNDIFSQKLQI